MVLSWQFNDYLMADGGFMMVYDGQQFWLVMVIYWLVKCCWFKFTILVNFKADRGQERSSVRLWLLMTANDMSKQNRDNQQTVIIMGCMDTITKQSQKWVRSARMSRDHRLK